MDKRIKTIFTILILAVTLYFLWHQFYSNWEQLKGFDWQFNYLYLILAFVAAIFFYFIAHLRWRMILKQLGHKLSFYSSLKYWMFAELGRYIPGKLWYVMGRAYFGKKEGIRRSVVLLSTFLELSILSVTSIIVFLIGVTFVTQLDFTIIGLSILAILILLIAIHPKIFNYFFNLALKLLKRKQHRVSIPYNKMLKIIVVVVLMWIVHGSAFYLTSKAIYPLELSLAAFALFVGVFAISWFIGFASFLTPGGIGVREAIMTYFLSFYIPSSFAVIMAVAFRLVLIVVEFGFGAVLFSLHNFFDRKLY